MMSDKKEPLPSSLQELDSELRATERKILAEIPPSSRLLTVALLVFALAAVLLLAPFVGAHGRGVLGRDLLAGHWPAEVGPVSTIARVFTYFVAALLVASVAALVVRRWGLVFLAAAVSCVSSVFGVFAIWHSQTVKGEHAGAQYGLILAAGLVVVLAFNLVRLTTARLGE